MSFGGDFRGSLTYTDFPDAEDVDPAFATDELRAYLDVHVIPDRLSIYFDQKLARAAAGTSRPTGDSSLMNRSATT